MRYIDELLDRGLIRFDGSSTIARQAHTADPVKMHVYANHPRLKTIHTTHRLRSGSSSPSALSTLQGRSSVPLTLRSLKSSATSPDSAARRRNDWMTYRPVCSPATRCARACGAWRRVRCSVSTKILWVSEFQSVSAATMTSNPKGMSPASCASGGT